MAFLQRHSCFGLVACLSSEAALRPLSRVIATSAAWPISALERPDGLMQRHISIGLEAIPKLCLRFKHVSVVTMFISMFRLHVFDRSHFGSSTVLVLVPFHIDPQMYNHDLSFGVDQPAALRAQSGVKSALEVTIHPALEPSTNPAHCADLLSAKYHIFHYCVFVIIQ